MDVPHRTVEPGPGQGRVLLRDGHHQVGEAGEGPLQGVEHQPVLPGRPPVEVEAVSDVHHPGPLPPGPPGGQPGQDPSHGGVAHDEVVVLRLYEGLEPPVGLQVLGVLGGALEGDGDVPVRVPELQPVLLPQVVPGGHMHLVPPLLEGLEIGEVELADVAEHSGGI